MVEGYPEQNYDKARVDMIMEDWEKFALSLPDYKYLEVQKRVHSHLRELESKYENARECALFHRLAGSSIVRSMAVSTDDFPGTDSLELYLESLKEEFSS